MSSNDLAVSSRLPTERFGLGVALLVLSAVIAYLPAINAGFIWDDNLLLTANRQIEGVWGLSQIWLGKNSCDYTPLTLTTFWLEHAIWGNTPTGYHVVNILLHALAAVLLWRNLSILRIRGSWLAALLFVIHPVNVASVAWIAELKNTLSAVLFFASLLAFLMWQERPNEPLYAVSIALFALAGLSKGAVVSLPIVLCLCILWRNGKITCRNFARVTPFAFVAIAVALLTIRYQTRAPDYGLFSFDPLSRLVRAGTVVWLYLGEIFWPTKLSPMFAQWQPNLHSPITYLPAVFLFILLAILFWKRNGWGGPPLVVSGYYILMLLPVLGLVWMALQQEASCADWWQYLAAPGIFAGVAAGFCAMSDQLNTARLSFYAMLCVALSMLMIQTWRRGAIYESMETYCRAALAENPHAWALQTNLGVVLAQRGEFEQAIAHDRQALRDNPRYMQAHNNLGNALRAVGNLHGAESEFLSALQLSPSNPIVLANLADTYFVEGRIGEALAADAEAIKVDRYNPQRYTEFGLKLAANKQFEQAIVCFRNALLLAPNDVANQAYLLRALADSHHQP